MASEIHSPAPLAVRSAVRGKIRTQRLMGLALAVAVLLVYLPVLVEWVRDWMRDDNYQHGFLIPPISAFIIWSRRRVLREAPVSPSWLGAGFLMLSCALLVLGTAGAEVFTQRVSFLGVLGSLVVFLLGWRHLGMTIFPIAFLFLAIPLPYVIYYALTGPMQLLATKVAINGLQLIGVPAWAAGNIIVLSGIELEVAEACSGIRSLYAFLALGALAAWSTPVVAWLRVAIFLTAIPLSIAGNAIRVFLTGVAVHVTGSPDVAKDTVHETFGMVTMTGGLLVFLVLRALVARAWGAKPTTGDEASARNEVETDRDGDDGRSTRRVAAARIALASLLLVASGGFAETLRSAQTTAGTIPPLAALPREVCGLQSVDVIVDSVSREVLAADTLLYRKYYRAGAPFADVLIAYFDQQRVNSQIHSPRNCMPGSGWRIATIGRAKIEIAGQQRPVTHMVIKKDREERHVYYWFLTQRGWTASEYRLKWDLIVCALGDRPTNAAFMRVDGETTEKCLDLVNCLDTPMREVLEGTGLYGTSPIAGATEAPPNVEAPPESESARL